MVTISRVLLAGLVLGSSALALTDASLERDASDVNAAVEGMDSEKANVEPQLETILDPLIRRGIGNTFDAREATIDSVHHAIYSGLNTCHEVVSSFLARIQAYNNRTNAIITLNPNALSLADRMDETLAAGNATGRLFCIPILLKDNYDTADMPTSGGALALKDSQPTEDAPSVAALREEGAIILGKANLHELALEGLSVSSFGGQTINPYDSTRTPGGSSGGSGAAVAASFCVFATGTDTVNSLRSPASANSLFSIRPTRGLVTRRGIMPCSFTQDAIGPIARTMKDVAVALTVMCKTGYDPSDNATAAVPSENRNIDYSALPATKLSGLRLGVLEGFFNHADASDPEVAPVNRAMDTWMKRLAAQGATLIPINETIYNATALAQLDTQRLELRESMDQYLQRPSLGGKHPDTLPQMYARKATNDSKGEFLVIPAQYEFVNTALRSSTSNATYEERRASLQDLALALHGTFAANEVDALIYPEQKNLAVKIGSPSQAGRNGILAALTGFPVVTIPVGFSERTEEAPVGVPIGMEILGRPFEELKLLGIGNAMEMLGKVRRAPEWARGRPEGLRSGEVPVVRPDSGNVSPAYPLGTL